MRIAIFDAERARAERPKMNTATQDALNTIAAHRKIIFDVIGSLEQELHCEIDPRRLMHLLDLVAPKVTFSQEEANKIILSTLDPRNSID